MPIPEVLIVHRATQPEDPSRTRTHQELVFAGCPVVGGVSGRLFATGLCLPSGSSLTTSDLDRICEAVRSVARA